MLLDESAKLLALRALVPYVPRASRALVFCVSRVPCSLVPYVLSCPTCLVFYVISCSTCSRVHRAIVSYLLSCLPCHRALRALVPHVPRSLRVPVFHATRASCALGSMWPCALRFMSPFF